MCVCVFINKLIYTHTHTYIHIYVFILSSKFSLLSARANDPKGGCVSRRTRYIYTCIYTYIYMYTYIYIYIYIYRYIYMNIYIYTYVCAYNSRKCLFSQELMVQVATSFVEGYLYKHVRVCTFM